MTEKQAADPAGLIELLRKRRDDFLSAHLPTGASGQVRSVCARFALAAAGGSLATALELTGWPEDEADKAAAICFRIWLGNRGSAENSEIDAGIQQVIAFIEAHGASRFEVAWDEKPERIINRVGFRRRDGDGPWQYMILPQQWRAEVCRGFDAAAVARAMADRGMIVAGNDGRPARQVSVPGYGKPKLYCLSPGIIGDAEEDDAR